MLFSDSVSPSDKKDEQLHLKRFKLEDKSIYKYMHLVPIKESRTGASLTSNVYKFYRESGEDDWSGYALVKNEIEIQDTEEGEEDVPVPEEAF